MYRVVHIGGTQGPQQASLSSSSSSLSIYTSFFACVRQHEQELVFKALRIKPKHPEPCLIADLLSQWGRRIGPARRRLWHTALARRREGQRLEAELPSLIQSNTEQLKTLHVLNSHRWDRSIHTPACQHTNAQTHQLARKQDLTFDTHKHTRTLAN